MFGRRSVADKRGASLWEAFNAASTSAVLYGAPPDTKHTQCTHNSHTQQGGPGMPEMLTPTSAIMGAGLGNDCALITGENVTH